MPNELSGNLRKEYQLCTEECGGISLTDWSIIEVSGQDRAKFLHNMCTNEILKLECGKGCEAFITDVKGKIVAHVVVLVVEDRIFLVTVPGQVKEIIAHLDRYIIREDVQLTDVSGSLAASLYTGPKSSDFINLTFGIQSEDLDSPWSNSQCEIAGAKAVVTKADFLWTDNYLILTENPDLDGVDLITVSEVWNILRVESSFPLFGNDFDESNLPQEVDRNEQAINFNKGCYLGQETIARIDALGHVNKKICTLKFSGSDIASVGSKLLNDSQEVGVVTSFFWSPRAQAPLALAMVRRGFNDPGLQLSCGTETAKIIA